jgi:hypothetical protein
VREALLTRTLRTQRVEDRHRPLDVLGRAADHQAVTVVLAPHTTGHPAVEVADLLLRQGLRVVRVVGETRVPTVDHEVARRQQVAEFGDRLPGRIAGRDHHPDRSRRFEPLHQFGERTHVGHVGVAVETHHLVTGRAQPLAHVEAHLAETDETELHVTCPPEMKLVSRADAPASAGADTRGPRCHRRRPA